MRASRRWSRGSTAEARVSFDARREYRHRDADHVPPGAGMSTLAGDLAGDEAPERDGAPTLDVIAGRRRHGLEVIAADRVEQSLRRSRCSGPRAAPSGKDYVTGRRRSGSNAVSTNFGRAPARVSTSFPPLWTTCGQPGGAQHDPGGCGRAPAGPISPRWRTSRPWAAPRWPAPQLRVAVVAGPPDRRGSRRAAPRRWRRPAAGSRRSCPATANRHV